MQKYKVINYSRIEFWQVFSLSIYFFLWTLFFFFETFQKESLYFYSTIYDIHDTMASGTYLKSFIEFSLPLKSFNLSENWKIHPAEWKSGNL